LKIAFIVHQFNRQVGHGRYVVELASRFKKDNDVHVFTSVWEDPDSDGITFHKVLSWRISTLTTILTFALPATWMIGKSFDIVHAQGFTGFKQNVMTVHMVQRGWFQAMAGFLGRIPFKKKINRMVVQLLDHITFRKSFAKAFIAVSGRSQGDLIRFHHLDSQVVLHGVDTWVFTPANAQKYRLGIRKELEIGSDELIFLYVGDWQKAGKALCASLSKLPYGRLLVVTKTPPEVVIRDAITNGVQHRLLIIKGTKQVEKYYGSADVFVFPTFHDSFGMVISEAMASGLPVITNREAGAAELIEHGVSGWLTEEPWDADQIAEGMRALANDPHLRKRMGDAARKAIEPFTWDRCAAETMAVYHQVVRSKTAPTRFCEDNP
jgi:UDP-glucose:(heptosyl)LPS alpha-1,3-glucosyltransferase